MVESETKYDVPQIVDHLVQQAEAAGASDVHVQMMGAGAEVAFRLDGVMVPVMKLADAVAEQVMGRIKFLARLKTYQSSMPQDGRIDRQAVGARSDIRVATYPTVTGEKVVLRLFGEARTKSLNDLAISADVVAALQRFLRQTSGMLLLTGPAGSGKTTTIYACLRYLAELGGRHIITIEDPVEQIVPGVMQTEISEARGLTFAKAARHLLRQDPQVLVIGEIRDEETANIAVRAALTGHLLIATLHAGSCQGVYERFLDLCDDAFSAATAVEFVLNQRLVRRYCIDCNGRGCMKCCQTGFHGRVPIVEWVRLEEQQRIKIRQGERVEPVQTLRAAAKELIVREWTNESEIQRVLGE